ncbi:Peptidoglycan-binding (PGRP) domain of peptidoglycan hydrolases-containing protein [Saccharopolyspora kobensis]|uniref:Peptidoglycan-binding (PGRP) domain of peptidoglycan hydrolases-containing protein n=1 Tax=Saccharopolyspora kobensis TaxID=146035 RepID=A0A1H5WIP5_9PSEU|nr:Peptidoglycan-binding (PGRP) domain of peptidoglycan hydrolases-containing protein [Saccharopolyspora kobensis]SFD76090.1 Peptidoglycan-binding (PGRP) domain of peptidoglycan hydrolases-containing protein [Saccharopolyspora kobensis]
MVLRGVQVARRVLLAGGLAATAVGVSGIPVWASSSRRAAPEIASTSDWQAREPSSPVQVLDVKPVKIVVHHTATPNSEDTSQEHAMELARQIQDFHMDSNGWIDTGQNFTNSRGGWLLEGRHKSLSVLTAGEQHVLGAHAGEQNSESLGIENEGTYIDAKVPDALWDSLVELCAYMVAQYGIEPGEIYGHRDFMATECPGDVLYARLPELREAVGAAAGKVVAQPVVWPLLRSGSAGPRVSALQLLLRARGESVPVDGVFGGRTQEVAARLAAELGATGAECSGTRVAEPGLFGGRGWDGLVPVVGGGASGDVVRAVQALLISGGRYVPADARFSDRMVSVVREFQAAGGLAVTGVVDRATWQRLLA